MLSTVTRLTKRVPEGPFQKYAPWRPDLLSILPHDTDTYCGNAFTLDRTLYQSDGPVADASGGDEEGVIDLLVNQHLGYLGGGVAV